VLNKDGLLQEWDIKNSSPKNRIKLPVPLDSIISSTFNPVNKNEIVTINAEGSITAYRLDSPLKPTRIELKNDKAITASYDPTGSKILVITEKGVLTIHEISRPNRNPVVISTLPNRLTFGRFNPLNPTEIITASDNGVVQTWDLNKPNKSKITEEASRDTLWFAGYNPQEIHTIFAGGKRKRLWLWNLKKSEEPPLEFEGHTGTIIYGVFNQKNPKQIMTSGQDELTNIWNLNSLGKPISIREPGEEIIDGDFNSQDFHQMLTIGNTGRLRIYVTEGNELLNKAYFSLSRCLTDREMREDGLDAQDIQSVKNNFDRINEPPHRTSHQQPYCNNTNDEKSISKVASSDSIQRHTIAGF
jgi:WD40 repeat protein